MRTRWLVWFMLAGCGPSTLEVPVTEEISETEEPLPDTDTAWDSAEDTETDTDPDPGDPREGRVVAKLVGEAANDMAGWAVAGPGDVDGDGLADLLVAAGYSDATDNACGAVYLLSGPVEGEVSLADASTRLVGGGREDLAGHGLSGAGDVDGDGRADLLVGAPQTTAVGEPGYAALVLAPGAGELVLPGDAALILVGEAPLDAAGYAVAGVGDATGDGVPDLLVGAPNHLATSLVGTAYLVSGDARGRLDLGDAYAELVGERTEDRAGIAVGAAGDVDGDGLADLLVGALAGDTHEGGAVYVVSAPVASGVAVLSDLGVRLDAEADHGCSWLVDGAGDVNGDGLADVLVGDICHDGAGIDAGAAFVVLGPVEESRSLAAADGRILGDRTRDRAGIVSGFGDADGDGLDDVLVGATLDEDSRFGAVFLVRGPALGVHALADATWRWSGEAAWDQAGFSVAGVGDTDGDGFPDLLFGAVGEDSGGSLAGAAYLATPRP